MGSGTAAVARSTSVAVSAAPAARSLKLISKLMKKINCGCYDVLMGMLTRYECTNDAADCYVNGDSGREEVPVSSVLTVRDPALMVIGSDACN